MTVTLHLPPHVEQAYLAAAQAKGVPIDDFVCEVLIAAQQPARPVAATVYEQGLGLFGSPEDAALLDEVVTIAYDERRRSSSPSVVL